MGALRGLLVSDFNLGNLARYLDNDDQSPGVVCTVAPFGQVIPTMLEPPAEDPRFDFALVWSSPQHASTVYGRCLDEGEANADEVLAEVEAYAAVVRSFAGRVGTVLVPTWTPTRHDTESMLLAMKPGRASSLLFQMNLRLASCLEDTASVHLLDATPWMAAAGPSARDPKLWYLAKVPFANDVFVAATKDVKAALRGLRGQTRKLVIVDLDDTLWGGLVGDTSWEQLRLGGHDAAGEAFVDFQRRLKTLTKRGVILGIVSKNEADVALEAIDRHPEMVLRRDDFAGWRINREDKARNIVELVHELNLGLDAAVFIDDSPVERQRVRDALPEVLVPEWPADCMLYPKALAELRCFDAASVTEEDAQRASMYASERSRTDLLARVGSVDEWLRSLELHVVVEDVEADNLSRVVQLLNKTNQMNLATRRLTESEMRDWMAGPGRRCWCFRVRDRLGDSGITGLLSVERVDGAIEVRDFILSCRVMGRKVEETMLHVAVEYARTEGLDELRAAYLPTKRNRPCLEFLERAGFDERRNDAVFVWRTERALPVPDVVECHGLPAGHAT